MSEVDSFWAVRYHTHGKPDEVLVLEKMSRVSLQPNEVRVRLLAATINPSDLGMIAGSYGRLRELPAVGGREGVGEVIELGKDVSSLAVGDRVQMPEATGVWRQETVAAAEGLMKLPATLSPEQLATAFVNPATAVRLLDDFGDLQPGDWLIQNAANSAVGFCVAGYAKHLGLRTLNVVRDAQWESALKEAGADVVVTEDSDFSKNIKTLTDGALPKLGLNSIGGESVANLIRCMDDNATLVTFGGMVGDKIRFPTRQLIFNGLTLRGYWMDKWNREQSREILEAFYKRVFQLIEDGVMQVPIDSVHAFEDAVEGVLRGFASSRRGKVIIKNA